MTSRGTGNIIPVLDLALFHTNRQAFVDELREACHLVGFFLIRHDFQDIADTMIEESRKFFSRSLEEKNRISYVNSPSFRGYMPLGLENTQGKVDGREQIEWAAEYPRDGKSWPLYERLKAIENSWPDYQPELKTATIKFTNAACYVADCIRDALCSVLELDEVQTQDILSKFEVNEDRNELPHWVIKIISYPQVEKDGPIKQGVGPHTDTNFLTLVLQDSVGGLQAYSQEEWIDVPTEYGTSVLVCNLGEQAQVWSRGYLLATPHQVLPNTSSITPRTSVPLFYNPVISATIEPIPEEAASLLRWERPQSYKHWKRDDDTMHTSVGENTFKSLARSHPEVFQKHHPDLEIRSGGHICKRESQL